MMGSRSRWYPSDDGQDGLGHDYYDDDSDNNDDDDDVRRADLCDEVWKLDLWWLSGEDDDRGNDGQGGLGVRTEYLRNNDGDDDDRNIYLHGTNTFFPLLT